MHVKTLRHKGMIVFIEIKNDTLVARFLKDGERFHQINNLSTLSLQGFEMAVYLSDTDNAFKFIDECIAQANQSKHSPFLKLGIK